MSADTAKLLASLDLQDQMSPKLKGAIGNVSQAEGKVASLGSRLSGLASNLSGGVSNAVTHFGGRIKQLGLGLAAAAGIGGLLSFTGALEKGLSKAQEWGLQIEKLQGITHDSATSLSGLLAVTEKYGLSNERLAQIAGFTEKALGAIAIKSGAAAKFTKAYGFSVTDAHGKVKDFSTLLLTFSDFWKKGAETPAIKAAAAAKLFGRGYADLVPILNLGKKGIQDAEAEAAALGLTLTQNNVVALAKAREATRKWGDAVGGLELQIGINLLPALTKLATAATTFVAQHGKDIVKFFTDAVAFGEKATGVIGGFAGKLAGFWNGIPAPLRDLLVKGIVADRTVKFFFGISPIKLVASLATDAIGSIGKTIAGGITKTVFGGIQKVFVVNMGLGGLGGAGGGGGLFAGGLKGIFGRAAGGLGGALGGGAGLGAAGILASGAALVASLVAVQKLLIEPGEQSQAGRNITGTRAVIATGDPAKIATALQGVKDSVNSLDPLKRALYELNANGVKTHTEGLEAALAGALADAQKASERNLQPLPDKISAKLKKHFDAERATAESNRIKTVTRINATTTAIDTEKSAIVRAIEAARTSITVNVSATGGISYRTTLYLQKSARLTKLTALA